MLVLTALSEEAEGSVRLAPTANQTPSGNTDKAFCESRTGIKPVFLCKDGERVISRSLDVLD